MLLVSVSALGMATVIISFGSHIFLLMHTEALLRRHELLLPIGLVLEMALVCLY